MVVGKDAGNIKIDYNPIAGAIELVSGKLWKELIRPGSNDECPPTGSDVNVQYIGTLTDGSEFDRSRKPFMFTLGKKQVIQGWEQGVGTMTKGEVCNLIIHPDLAYGAKGTGKIPANATLCFQIELIDWKHEDLSPCLDGGIIRKILTRGITKYYHPNDGAVVKIAIEGFINGEKFDDRTVEFIMGEGSEHKICSGIETALYKMSDGEKCELTLKPHYAFNSEGSKSFSIPIPPYSVIVYIVTLQRFTKGKEVWNLDGSQKMECALEFKEKGTKFFREKKYVLAKKYYKKTVDFLRTEASLIGDEEEERKRLLAIALLNQSQCCLELKDYLGAKNTADEGLQLEPDNVKGLFRRGLGNLGLQEPALAKKDFERILQLEPGNKQAAVKSQASADMIRKNTERERKLYAKMIGQ